MSLLMRKFSKNNNGTETMEMVILLPVLLFVVFSSVSFILAMYSKICVADVARETARTVALSGSDDDIENENLAVSKSKSVLKRYGLKEELLHSTDVQIIPSDDDSDNITVIVEVTYKQPSIFPMLPKLVGNNPWNEYFRIRSKAIFKKEGVGVT